MDSREPGKRPMLTRRDLLKWTALGSAGLYLAGCGTPAAAPTAPPAAAPTTVPAAPTTAPAATKPAAAATTAPTAAPKGPNRVVIGMSQEPDSLGSFMGSMVAAATVKTALGSETTNYGTSQLVWRSDKNEKLAGLCESVPTVDNGGAKFVGEGADRALQVTYKLKKNVKWQDGTAMTSKDAKLAFDFQRANDFPISDRSDVMKVAKVETPDDSTVVYTYLSEKGAKDAYAKEQADITAGKMKAADAAYADFKDQSGPVLDPTFNAMPTVVPSSVWGKMKPSEVEKSDYSRKPIAVGPYKLTQWTAGQSLVLDVNPDFFMGKPKIDQIVFKIIPDTNTMLAQLKTGDVDVVNTDALSLAQAPDLDNIAKEGKVKINYIPAMVWEHIDYNMTNEHLKDPLVRKAIAHATNRQGIVDQVMNGKTQVIHSWLPPISWAYNKDVTQYPYDVAKAKSLLQQAGYTAGSDGMLSKGGKALKLKLTTTAGNKQRELVVQIVQQNLKAVGIAMEIELMPSADYFATGGKGPLNNGSYELGLYAWSAGDDPGGLDIYHSKNIPTKDNAWSGQNYPRWKNTRADELITKAMGSLSEKERLPLYIEHQKLFSEDLPSLPLYARPNISAVKVNLKNFKPAPTNTSLTWNCYEWEWA